MPGFSVGVGCNVTGADVAAAACVGAAAGAVVAAGAEVAAGAAAGWLHAAGQDISRAPCATAALDLLMGLCESYVESYYVVARALPFARAPETWFRMQRVLGGQGIAWPQPFPAAGQMRRAMCQR